MKSNLFRAASAVLALTAAVTFAACDEHENQQAGTNAQNQQFTQNKEKELAIASGNINKTGGSAATYTGTVRMVSSNNSYPCTLIVSQQLNIQHLTGGTSPADTVQVPQLTATLSFPFFDSINPQSQPGSDGFKQYEDALTKYTDLVRPMGQQFVIQATYGDYTPKTQMMILPYQVSGYTGNYGQISGKLVNGHFTGEWDTTVDGVVGYFDLARKK